MGADKNKNIPFRAVAMVGYADKITGGLQQFMAGARKFNLKELSRNDLITSNRETEEITKIPFMTDALDDKAKAILRS